MREFTIDDVEILVANEHMCMEVVGVELFFTTDLRCDVCCPPKLGLTEV